MKYLQRVIVCLLTVSTIFAFNSFGQSSDAKKYYRKGKKFVKKEKFNAAKEQFDLMLNAGTADQEHLFLSGVAYYRSKINMEKSVELFEKALQNVPIKKDTIDELLFYTGRAYHFVDRFEDAIVFYNKYKSTLRDNKTGKLLKSEVDHYIEQCNNGTEIIATKNETVVLTKLPPSINSLYAEYVPVLSIGENMIIFCVRKPLAGEEPFGPDDFEYFENIYYSERKDGESWSKAEPIPRSHEYLDDKMNEYRHEAPVSLSPDGKTLYIYRDNEIFKSNILNGKWQLPEKMNTNVNLGEFNPSAVISPDGSELYIVSEAEGGLGGRDIYLAKKEGDSWGRPVNLGETINTPFYDDAPYISKNGRYLYFSSQGHNSMGGFDVFRSERQDNGEWGEPMNIGSPYNSSGDDIYYVENDNGTMAYYASLRAGSTGNLDIYAATIECQNIPMTEIKGYAILAKNGRPIGGTIHVVGKENGEDYGTFSIDGATGRYAMSLPPNATYFLEMEVDGYKRHRAHKEEFFIPNQCSYYNLFQQVALDLLYNEEGLPIAQRAHFRNAMFDIESEVKEAYQKEEIAQFDVEKKYMNQGIHGELAFNKLLKADLVSVYLIDDKNEIVRSTKTNDQGYFAFENIDTEVNYRLLVSEFDAKNAKNGLTNANLDAGVKLEGYMQSYKEKDSSIAKVSEVILIDENMKAIAYNKLTDRNFIVSNEVTADDRIQELKNIDFKYNMVADNPDILYTAFIKTIDPNNTELEYSEVIDIIDIQHNAAIPLEFANILFDFDKSFLRDTSKAILNRLSTYLKQNPQVHIKLDGHTDWFGTDEYNVGLSKRRSEKAFGYLIKDGIDESRLVSKWFGEANPTVNNENADGTDNAENRQLNRRVEIHVNSPELGMMVLSYNPE
jgi:outer membrane protein OmpA-like peptidoglycan-associated protein/tetratricopeptide (TPR) repeat protein